MDIQEEVTTWVKSIKPDAKTMEITVEGFKIFLAAMAAMRTDHIAEMERLNQLLYGGRCVYCGDVVGQDTHNQDLSDETLRQHVLKCQKHPAAKLREALSRIAEPVWWMQEDQLKSTGSINGLDGATAIALANDPGFLKGIAKKALAESV